MRAIERDKRQEREREDCAPRSDLKATIMQIVWIKIASVTIHETVKN